MKTSFSPWWVPAASFAVAITLALVSGPATRHLLARAPADTTGPCQHDPFTIPGINAKASVRDGTSEPIVNPVAADFDLNRVEGFATTFRSVIKSRDGSLTCNARRHRTTDTDGATSTVEVANESNKAQVGHKLTNAGDGDCCHGVDTDGVGTISFRLEVTGETRFGTSGTARIGSESTPVRMSIKAVYDQNCNGVEDSLENLVVLSAEVDCRRDHASRPITCTFTGFMEGKYREVVDNTGIETPPNRVTFDTLVQRGNGLSRTVERPIGFNNLSKAFPSTTSTTVDISKVNLSAKVERDRFNKHFPAVYTDFSYNTEALKALDTTESKLAELKKDP